MPEGELLHCLRAGEIADTEHVCLAGETTWRPIADVPELKAVLATPPVQPPPPPAPTGTSTALWSPTLPLTANLLILYGLFVCPFWLLVTAFSCLTVRTYSVDSVLYPFEFAFGVENTSILLVIAVVLFIGSIQLKRRRSSGVTIMKAVLWAAVLCVLVRVVPFLITAGALESVAMEGDVQESGPVADAVGIAMWLMSVGFTVFEVYGLIWLHVRSGEVASACAAGTVTTSSEVASR